MKIRSREIGVCSWSLGPAGAEELLRQLRDLQLDHVQLALGPLVSLESANRHREVSILLQGGVSFTGGMINFPGEDYSTIADIRRTGGIVPDALWPVRQERFAEAIRIASQLPIGAITTHIGFIPPAGDSGYPRAVQRVRNVAEMLAEVGLRLLMETGQESAGELAEFLEAVAMPAVGVNFDPANMILYGAGDPIEAVRVLGRWIGHVHVKDAIASDQPGRSWGREVLFGTGQVGAAPFLSALDAVGYAGPLVIERESGHDRAADVTAAIAALREAE